MDATVAFPLPSISGAGIYHEPMELPSKDAVNFVDFRVSVAGQTIKPQADIRAYMAGQDVTARVRAVGLPVSVADAGLETALKKLAPRVRKQLLAEHLIECEEVGRDPNGPVHCDYWAGWETRVQFYWAQRFPARSVIKIEHSYRPVVGGGYICCGSIDGSWPMQRYCGGASISERIKKLQASAHPKDPQYGITVWQRAIDYVLTTANNWKGPIGMFHLTVIPDNPDDIVLTCMSGLREVSPMRYELSRSNFRPDTELKLLVLQADKSN